MIATRLGYGLARGVSGRIPFTASLRLAEALADWPWRTSASVRAAVSANLALARGEPVGQRDHAVRNVLRNFARYLAEFLAIDRLPPPAVQIDGEAHLRAARRDGLGAIVWSAHLGNWELGAIVLRRLGSPVTAVALPHPDPFVDRLFNAQRARCGVGVIPLGPHAARAALARLKHAEVLGVIGDWAPAETGVIVTCCGKAVRLPHGPALLSLISGRPIVPVFLLREGCWAFRLCVEAPLWPLQIPRQDRARAIQDLTQRCAGVLERYLKTHAEQWVLLEPVSVQ